MHHGSLDIYICHVSLLINSKHLLLIQTGEECESAEEEGMSLELCTRIDRQSILQYINTEWRLILYKLELKLVSENLKYVYRCELQQFYLEMLCIGYFGKCRHSRNFLNPTHFILQRPDTRRTEWLMTMSFAI